MFLEKLYASKDTCAIDTKAGWLDDWQEKMAGDNEVIECDNEKNKEYDEEDEGKALLTCKTAEQYWEEVCDRFDEVDIFESIETYYELEDEEFFEDLDHYELEDFEDGITARHGDSKAAVKYRAYKMLSEKYKLETFKVKSSWRDCVNDLEDFGEWGSNTDLKVVFKEGKNFESAYAQEALRWYVEDIAYNTLEQIEEENRD